jgi:hypothetical protein
VIQEKLWQYCLRAAICNNRNRHECNNRYTGFSYSSQCCQAPREGRHHLIREGVKLLNLHGNKNKTYHGANETALLLVFAASFPPLQGGRGQTKVKGNL